MKKYPSPTKERSLKARRLPTLKPPYSLPYPPKLSPTLPNAIPFHPYQLPKNLNLIDSRERSTNKGTASIDIQQQPKLPKNGFDRLRQPPIDNGFTLKNGNLTPKCPIRDNKH